ncbi:protein 5NUC-like [Neocloeon triangulifer]|uniref:protein 5NUC-like n=1 Tax=Neocloeon triangulifer TaxID=2078957 RepID=UPI00286F5DC7|nr:protein 5NUC-like [Neocloeon triangulifer]
MWVARACSILLVAAVLVFSAAADGHFKLVVLHNNDMHARFEQTNGQSGRCAQKHLSTKTCFGGFARVAQVVKDVRKAEENVIFLNAGDTYQGTSWYTVHKWRVVAAFLKMIGMDAMSLGNHEFDDGVDGLAPLLENITIPVLAANVDVSREPSLEKLRPSVILNVGGRKVGVIGYLTPETVDLVPSVGGVVFEDEVPAIRREVDRLRASGVNILIAVGHSGHSVDKKIAKEVDGLDLVVGGHSNTFLYTGRQPDSDIPADLYPTMVEQASGKKIPVVQAYAYTKYMGRMDLTFDKNGEIVGMEGKPILLDYNIEQDPDVLQELKPWAEKVASLGQEKVGKTLVFLNGSQNSCRMRECNLGNFVSDAFISHYASTYSGSGWTDAPIAVQNGGGIRSSIEESKASEDGTKGGFVTMEDVLTVLPFQTGVVTLRLKGVDLLETLEESVKFYDLSGVEAPGRFLQFSGLKVTYDMSKPPGKRVKSVMVRCGQCREPRYSPLDPNVIYGLVMSQYIADGGDGYHVLSQKGMNKTILDTEESVMLANYIKQKSPVFADIEGRITLLNTETADNGVASFHPTLPGAIIVFSIILFFIK